MSLANGTFKGLWRLRLLLLLNNSLSSLTSGAFTGLNNLRTLQLEGNYISYIGPMAFYGLAALPTLDLSHQQMQVIAPQAFLGLRNLTTLLLSHNLLKALDNAVFTGLGNLQKLDVSHNQLQTLNSRVFYTTPRLRTLEMDEWRWCCLAPKVDRCLPEPDEFSSCEDLMSNLVLRVCIWTLGFIALVGNTFVIIWRSLYSSGNKMHSFLIVNLALGDFMMGVYLIIIAAVDMQYRGVYAAYERQWRSSGLCQLAGFISTFSSELSVFTLTVITVDRLIVIKFPFGVKRLDGRATRSVMVGVWVLVGTLATLPLFPLRYFSNFYGRSGVCLALHITNEKPSGWEYSVLIYLVLNMVSFGVIAASYALMYIIARDTHTAARNGPEQVMGGWRDVGMARRMTLIVATDALCWLPIIFLGIASLAGVTIPPKVFSWIAVFVLPLNAAVNPILYTLSTAPVRSHLRGLQRAVSKEPRDGLTLTTRATSIRSVNKSSMRIRRFSDVSLIALSKYSMKARKFSDVSDTPPIVSADIKAEENYVHICTTTKCAHNLSTIVDSGSNIYMESIQVINGGSQQLNYNIQGNLKGLTEEAVLPEHVSLFLQQSPESSSGTSCAAAEQQDKELVPLSDLTDSSEHRRSSKRRQRRKNQDLRYD